MTDKDYRVVPKPEPTPIFDRWKKCPDCESDKTELQVEYRDTVVRTLPDDPNLRVVRLDSQVIIVKFLCRNCDLASEERICTLDNVDEVEEIDADS